MGKLKAIVLIPVVLVALGVSTLRPWLPRFLQGSVWMKMRGARLLGFHFRFRAPHCPNLNCTHIEKKPKGIKKCADAI